MSTPDGKFRFINASIIFGVGASMSIILLWVLISNCSREFLSMNELLLTVYREMVVGSGVGPSTIASCLMAVSIICFTLMSNILCSYAEIFKRKRCGVSTEITFLRVFGFVSFFVAVGIFLFADIRYHSGADSFAAFANCESLFLFKRDRSD